LLWAQIDTFVYFPQSFFKDSGFPAQLLQINSLTGISLFEVIALKFSALPHAVSS